MKTNIYILLAFVVIGCGQQKLNSSIPLNKPDETVVIASRVDMDSKFMISLYSFIQANSSGLYITPSSIFEQTVLYKYPHKRLNECCIELEKVIREGKGPGELLQIYSSTKTINGDTLLFYSPNLRKYLSINETGGIINPFDVSDNIVSTGYSFAYSRGYLLVPTFNRFFSSDSLLTLINVNNDKQKKIFEARVPAGYEPAIRNQVVGMGALPEGFAISFIGDRKLYILDFQGKVKKELIFGESDPIPEPYKISKPKNAPSSKPYLTKIEFDNGHLFVLLDNLIWILEYPSYKPKTLLKVLRDPEEKSAPVIDFSIADETVYVRMGRDGLYDFPINPNWYRL